MCVCLKMRCNIQVSDVNASRTQRTNKQTDSRSRGEEEAEGAGRERERETAAERGVNHHGQQGERQGVSRAGGHRAGHQAGSYACQDECHIIAPKMVSKRQQRPNCSCSPCFPSFPCSGLFRVVILVNYESCSPAVLQSMGHQQQEQTHDTPRLSSSSRLVSPRLVPFPCTAWSGLVIRHMVTPGSRRSCSRTCMLHPRRRHRHRRPLSLCEKLAIYP